MTPEDLEDYFILLLPGLHIRAISELLVMEMHNKLQVSLIMEDKEDKEGQEYSFLLNDPCSLNNIHCRQIQGRD